MALKNLGFFSFLNLKKVRIYVLGFKKIKNLMSDLSF